MRRNYHEPRGEDDEILDGTLADQELIARPRMIDAAGYAEAEAERVVIASKTARERSDEVRKRHLWREYEIAGVQPMALTEDGSPTVSLSMLKRMGWSVQNVSGMPTLVRPYQRGTSTDD